MHIFQKLKSYNSFEVLIKPGISSLDIQTVAHLAHKIWNQHYVPIIGQQQVDYMLGKFQDAEAIKHQMENDYEYFIIYHQKNPCGYLALVPNTVDKKMMVSKIYVDSDFRNLKLGSQLLDFSIEEAKNRAFKSIWLTVNKNNRKSIEWYQNKGFSIKENIKIDIGNGFVMDDYLMELSLLS
jgi:ribosomal protein S18 acetylase RimI-like enzyme